MTNHLPVTDSKHLLFLIHHNMIKGTILLPRLLVMQHRMTMAESTSLYILPTQSNMVA